MKFLILLAIALILFSSSNANAITLSRNGKSEYVIILAADAIAPEKTAAKELADYLIQVTGAQFVVKSGSEVPPASQQILVGPSARVKTLMPRVDWNSLGSDGIVIKSVGDTLILAGGRPRGTLYAVYTFLEDVAGVKWWTSTDTFTPHRPTLTVKKPDIVYVPRLTYREEFYYDTINTTVFPARLKLNGRHNWVPEEYGGHITIVPWCHSFYQLLPPGKYFAEHPEWYSEINGKRTSENAQLCLTNEEMRKEMVKAALEALNSESNAKILSISQNDCGGRCQCDKCKAVEEEEGSPSGPIISFVNAVAEDIEKVRPDILVETLAYDYAVKPPKRVKPRRDVLIRLCVPWSVDQRYPYSHPINNGFGDIVRGWSSISPNLFFWDYPMLYPNFLSPFPDYFNLGANVQFMADSGAVGVFAEADSQHTNGEFVAMRAWVIAHMLWNPKANADKLIREFVNGYYGKAAPYLYQYMKLMHSASLKSGKRLSSNYDDYDPSFLTPDVLLKAMSLFADAEKAVAKDTALLAKVRGARASLDYVSAIQRPRLSRTFATNPKALETLHSSRPNAEAPDVCRGLSANAWVDIQERQFLLYGEPVSAQFVDDPQASDGKAARMPGGKVTWAVQHPIPITEKNSGGKPLKYRVYVSVRVEADGKDGTAFELGVYENPTGKHPLTRTVPLAEVADAGYHTYDLGSCELQRRTYIWADPTANPAVKAIYIDRIVLIPQE